MCYLAKCAVSVLGDCFVYEPIGQAKEAGEGGCLAATEESTWGQY